MMFIAIRLWINDLRGPLVVCGDAEGILADLVQFRAKSPMVNEIAKELALHLAPQGLTVAGIHIWGERNVLADELSRLAEPGATASRRVQWLMDALRLEEAPLMSELCLRIL